MTEKIRQSIILECERQEESCLYTSTSLYLWLRQVRLTRRLFIAAPIVLSVIAGISIIQDYLPVAVVVIITFLAGIFPALESALKLETDVEHISRQASEYKSLQDKFRRISKITALGDVAIAQQALEHTMSLLDGVRSASITAPEKYFLKAKKKIEAGHYSFEVDDRSTGL